MAGIASVGVVAAGKVPNVLLKLKEAFDPDGLKVEIETLLSRVDNKSDDLLTLGTDALRLGVIDRNGFEKCLHVERRPDGGIKENERDLLSGIIRDGCNERIDDFTYQSGMRI